MKLKKVEKINIGISFEFGKGVSMSPIKKLIKFIKDKWFKKWQINPNL